MKAAYIEQPGPPDGICYGDLPTPKATGAQVLVRVKAVSVNPIDTYIRSGAIALELPKPFIVGCDLAGTVEEVGPEVTDLRPGDRVWGSNQGLLGRQGVFSEFAAVERQWLHSTPPNVSDRDAAALALVGITAHLGLVQRAQLQPGETIFVQGGSGGVGSCVVQMAKAIGARVIASAGSEAKAELCRTLGADVVVNYKTENADEAIRSAAPKGVDVWWEMLREPSLQRAVGLLALRGRLVLMAGRQATPAFPLGPFYVKDCTAVGFAMFNSPAERQRVSADQINRWTAEGKLRARIDRVLPLSETAAAHRLQEESTVQTSGALPGKIVLEP